MRITIQALSIVLALVLGVLFGMDFAGEEDQSSKEAIQLSPSGNRQMIQLTPHDGKVEIEVVDANESPQVIKVEPTESKEAENRDANHHELKSSMLGEMTNTIGSSLRGQTRKLLEWIVP